MAHRKDSQRSATQRRRPAKGRSPRPKTARKPSASHFVGREGSPILDKYPPKSVDAAVGENVATGPPAPKVAPRPLPTPPSRTAAPSAPTAMPASAASQSPAPSKPLISLETPFDVDEFSQLLGQTHIRVTVPRDSLAEVLRRACDFMGFGIYVYSIRVRPGPEELLKSFVVELERVDYSASAGDWAPFQERGRAESPFGPTGTR